MYYAKYRYIKSKTIETRSFDTLKERNDFMNMLMGSEWFLVLGFGRKE